MTRLNGVLKKSLSLRISLVMVFAIAVLLLAALLVMLRYSRRALKEEAFAKADQTLEATVLHVDNILLSVEQTAGNFYWDILLHLNEPERLRTYVTRLVESNRQIEGAAIAFEPYFYKDRGEQTMFYPHRTPSGSIVQAESFGSRPYIEQSWYTEPLTTGKPCWINPLKNDDTEDDALISFCLPLYAVKNGVAGIVGVLGVDVSLAVLSDIVLSTKPSPNSYATMLGSDGSFIVHPDSDKVLHHTIFTLNHKDTDPMFLETARAMMAGETGWHRFNNDGTDCLLFYKPFRRDSIPGRAMLDLGWSIGVVYPVNDIFGDSDRQLVIVVIIAVVSLLLLLVFCRWLIYRQLEPLHLLTESAQRIADGHFEDVIPDSRQQDEVGRLQNHFQQMQQSLSQRIGELYQLTEKLKDDGRRLSNAYEKAKIADRMKTEFMHNMTNQMLEPVVRIEESVKRFETDDEDMARTDSAIIQKQGATITELLDDLLRLSVEKSNTIKTETES